MEGVLGARGFHADRICFHYLNIFAWRWGVIPCLQYTVPLLATFQSTQLENFPESWRRSLQYSACHSRFQIHVVAIKSHATDSPGHRSLYYMALLNPEVQSQILISIMTHHNRSLKRKLAFTNMDVLLSLSADTVILYTDLFPSTEC